MSTLAAIMLTCAVGVVAQLKPSTSLIVLPKITQFVRRLSVMNKTELVKELANSSGMTQKGSALWLDTFQDVVAKALISGDSVDIMGFGSFFLKKREACIKLVFGVETDIPASKSVGFKPGKTLKDAVN